jgi:glycosyltransferase involved in cell wall biosynthesis
MEKILSIIIPTYNMEKYLSHCLDSLLIDEGLDDVEVLVINDGSKDSSLAIAQDYQSKYPNTFRVIDKENGNYGSCINRGLKEATGKYIKVLDADDSFNTETFQEYVSVLKNIDVDLVLTDFLFVDESDIEIRNRKYDYIPSNTVLDFEKLCSDGLDMIMIMMHAVTYKRENLIKMNYKQTEGISYTDNEWIFTPMLQVKKAYHINKPLYLYLIGREGQTVETSVQYKNFKQEIKVTEDMITQIQSVPHKNAAIESALYTLLRKRISLIYRIVLVIGRNHIDNNLLVEFDNFLKLKEPELYHSINNSHLGNHYKFYFVKCWRKNGRKKIANYHFWPFKIMTPLLALLRKK